MEKQNLVKTSDDYCGLICTTASTSTEMSRGIVLVPVAAPEQEKNCLTKMTRAKPVESK
jgi:hypothetical protein